MFIRTSIIALALVATSTPALARTGENSLVVRYGDLDLATESGRARFETRIRSAARKVCETGLGGIRGHNEQAKCMAQAIAQAEIGL